MRSLLQLMAGFTTYTRLYRLSKASLADRVS